MIKEKSCGCVVINDNKVLLIKHNKGHWDFPKGHIEENETEMQTAIREVKEETNIDVQIISDKRYMINYTLEEKNINKDVVFFLAKPINLIPRPQLEEVEIVIWKEFDEAKELITYENSKNVFEEILADLNKM